MNQIKSTLIFIVAIMLMTTGCAKKASDEIDFGAIKNNIYKNKYFSLSVTLPPTWSVQDENSRKQNIKLAKKMLAGDDKNLTAVMKASEMSSVSLFTATKHPIGTPVSFNPSISCVAERISHMPGLKTGQDYLFHAKKLLQSSQMKVSFPKKFSNQSLGGHDFGVMYVDMNIRGTRLHQKYYATLLKGYALAFVISFSTNEDELALQNILNSMSFE